jgi:hypothetical protein
MSTANSEVSFITREQNKWTIIPEPNLNLTVFAHTKRLYRWIADLIQQLSDL